jgi:tetratricopeptide (TPR) repeat protein
VLDRLWRCLDDPREQALVREQLARIRLARVRDLAAQQEPGSRLAEQAAALAERAAEDLRFCLVHMPEHRWIREALGELLRLQGNLPALVLHLQEWARTQTAGPGRAAILLQLGQVHERDRRDLARAAEVYELAVAEDPENPSCLRALGYVYERLRRWPQAVAALRRQADQTDDETERLAALRRVAVMAENELGDVDLAIASLEEIAKHAPEDLLSLYQLVKLCRAHRRTGVLIGALELLVARVDDDVARTALLVELGEVQELSLKQRQGARTCYERALALTPGYTPALRALSRLYRDNGQLDELVRLFDPKVDTVSDPSVLALKAARVCFEEIGDVERAIEQLWVAYRGNPDLVPARELLLQLLTASARIEEAYDLLRAQDPPRSPAASADYHYRLGLLAEASSRQQDANAMPRKNGAALRHEDAALQHYRAALVQQPDHGLAQERSRRLLVAHHDVGNLARMLEGGGAEGLSLRSLQLARLNISEQGGLAAARRAYEAAYEAAPDDPIIRRELEGLLRLAGDKRSLPALYLRAARETKDTHLQATLLVEAAEMLLQSGAREDYELAGNAILDALRVDPGSPYAVRHLERLLSDPDSPFVIKDAVSARAVRAQSDAERAIFYLESAELLERVGAWGQARRAYLAAKGALPQLAPADLGLNRLVSDNRRAAAAAQHKMSIHVLLAEARDAVVRATRGDAQAAARAIELLGEILQRDPQSRDAVALARALAGQIADPAPVVQLLAAVFGRVEAPELRYEIALFLGDRAAAPDHAVRYFEAATRARPDGRRALRGLIGAYRQLGDDRRAAAATERLLELFDPTEPSAIDLRMGVAAFLAASPETLPRALDHARTVLEVRADDPRAMQLMADLLERAGKREEAAAVLDRLAARERGRERLHDIHLRRAKLLADLPGRERDALDAIERAAAINPGNRETVALFVEQLHRTGQSARIATYLPPIRSAVVTNIGRGALSIRDLRLLARVAEVASPPLCRVATAMVDALEPPSDRPRVRQAVSEASLRLVLDTASLRNALLAEGEPAALHALVGAVEGVVARLIREFPVVGPLDVAQIPRTVDAADATESARRYAEVLGLRPPRLLGSNTHNTVMLLQDVVPSIRFGLNLWNQADAPALRGLVAVSLARFAFGAPRARALPPAALDLLLAASFEAVEVFNPMTGDHDAKRLAELVTQLRTVLPRRQRKIVEDSCRALASYAFDSGATARAMRTSDLRLAAVLSTDPGACLAAACLLDGVVGGSLKERINRSRSAQELVVFLLGDDGLAVQAAAADASAG